MIRKHAAHLSSWTFGNTEAEEALLRSCMSWMGRAGVIVQLLAHSSSHHEGTSFPAICNAWSENTFTHLWGSSEHVHRFYSPLLSSGTFPESRSPALQPSPVSESPTWLLWWTLRITFRTLNPAPLHNTVPLPISLRPRCALTWPQWASSRVLYNTEHSRLNKSGDLTIDRIRIMER